MHRVFRWLRFNWMYFGKPPWNTGISPPELISFIKQHPPGQAIDLGCGVGVNLLALGKAGWQVTGVDFALKAVVEARRRLIKAGIPGDVRAGDVTRLEKVRGKYDLVLDIGCYHGLTLAGRNNYRRNLEEILKPGGHFLLYVHWNEANSPAAFGFSPADLDALTSKFHLASREDSSDRMGRKASWLLFRNDEQMG